MGKNSRQVLAYEPEKKVEVKTSLVKNILVPFDDSSYSSNAFDFALDLAKRYHAKVHVISVMYSNAFASSFLDLPVHQTSIEKARLDGLSKSLVRLEQKATKFEIPFVATLSVSSSVAETVLSYASSYKIDLIVMGTRGRHGGPRHLRLGSVAIDVSQSAKCPVLFVK